MLVGESPFVGETVSDSIGAVLHKQYDFNQLPAATPPNVRRVLARCLERDKSLRYRDIGDVRIELIRDDDAPHVEPAGAGRDGGLGVAMAVPERGELFVVRQGVCVLAVGA